MIQDLLEELKKSSFSILPIFLWILLLWICGLVSFTLEEGLYFFISTILVILGIALFNYGAEHSMTPIGKKVGRGLTKKGNLSILFISIFLLGFLITIAEPDLTVLSLQTKSIIEKPVLILSIGLSVGAFLLLAVLKILHKTNLVHMLSLLYMIAFGLLGLLIYQNKEAMVALCFDSGGVTTGPMTVPFLMALGAGIAGILAERKEKDASFGFVAFSSIGPIIAMLVLSLFTKGELEYELADYTMDSNFVLSLLSYILEKLKSVGLAMGALFAGFLCLNALFLHVDRKTLKKLIIGLLFAYIGLVIFLAAVDCVYMSMGFKIGESLESLPTIGIFAIAFVIGALTVLAEPAIKILVEQVEDQTNGLIKRKSMLLALALGVGLAIAASLLRIRYQFSILYIIIPGYILCFILSFFVPRIYTAIAFDAGGVASGPLTSSFILPIAIGLCSKALPVNEILTYGFGVVALVALSPLLSIEILGVVSSVLHQKKVKKELRKALQGEDKVWIRFM